MKKIKKSILALLLVFAVFFSNDSILKTTELPVKNDKSTSSALSSTASKTVTHHYNYSNQNASSTVSRVKLPEDSETVYRTPMGKRYHLISTCGGKNSYEISRDEAICAGLTPCQKCAK